MPRCLMAKKWKAYPWPERPEEPADPPDEEEEQETQTPDQPRRLPSGAAGTPAEEDEEIDVVGDSPAALPPPQCWGPSSPTAGATAPSPPPHSPSGTTILYNGESRFISLIINIFLHLNCKNS